MRLFYSVVLFFFCLLSRRNFIRSTTYWRSLCKEMTTACSPRLILFEDFDETIEAVSAYEEALHRVIKRN